METLTKENFWNEMEQKYPKAMVHFKEWIDGYKKANDWNKLFSNYLEGWGYAPEHLPKYHELPIAMQFGIFLEWLQTWSDMRWRYTLNNGVKAAVNTALMLLEAKL